MPKIQIPISNQDEILKKVNILGKFRQTRVLSLDDAMHVLPECIHSRMCSKQTQTHTGSKFCPSVSIHACAVDKLKLTLGLNLPHSNRSHFLSEIVPNFWNSLTRC